MNELIIYLLIIRKRHIHAVEMI